MKIFLSLLENLIVLIKWPLYIALGLYVLFVVNVALHVIGLMLLKKMRFKKSTITKTKVKKSNFIKKLIWDFPHQYAIDTLNLEPGDFKEYGLIVFTGRQGSGKTSSLVEYMGRLQQIYPESKTLTNFGYVYEDTNLNHWNKLTDYVNGRKGVIVGIDETQNWFSCNQSKNFPPEMLSVITQNRKNRRIILGTAQNFYLLSKAIRSQTTEVRECYTFFGCLTFVFRKIPILDVDGNVEKWKNKGFYFFVHNEKLRNSYDTYKCIENMAKSGFYEKQTSQ